MGRILHGKARGRMIELDEDLGMPEGQDVEVEVKVLGRTDPSHSPMSEGLDKV